MGFNSIDAQNKKYSFFGNESPVAVGFSYERIQDANYQGERNDNKGSAAPELISNTGIMITKYIHCNSNPAKTGS